MRAVRGVWDSGATIIHWVVELEGAVTRRGSCCVGVVFTFPVSVCENCLCSVTLNCYSCFNCLAFSLLRIVLLYHSYKSLLVYFPLKVNTRHNPSSDNHH